MRKLKRIGMIALVLSLVLCLCACVSASPTTPSASKKPEATTTTPVPTTTVTVPATTNDGKVDYTVTVLYPDGTPVVGESVQICTDEMCYIPQVTDENGVVVFRMREKDGYKVKLENALEGYVEQDYIYFESGSTEITIQLVAAG